MADQYDAAIEYNTSVYGTDNAVCLAIFSPCSALTICFFIYTRLSFEATNIVFPPALPGQPVYQTIVVRNPGNEQAHYCIPENEEKYVCVIVMIMKILLSCELPGSVIYTATLPFTLNPYCYIIATLLYS